MEPACTHVAASVAGCCFGRPFADKGPPRNRATALGAALFLGMAALGGCGGTAEEPAKPAAKAEAAARTRYNNYDCAVAMTPDGMWLAVANGDGAVELWPVAVPAMRQVVRKFNQNSWRNWAPALAISADGALLAVADPDGGFELRSLPAGALVKAVRVRSEESLTNVSRSLAFSPDGKLLATGQFNGDVVVRSVPEGTLVDDLEICRDDVRSRGTVNAIAFSPNGGLIVAASADGLIRRWPRPGRRLDRAVPAGWDGRSDGPLLSPMMGQTPDMPDVRTLAISADSRLLITNGPADAIRLWSLLDMRPLETLGGHRAKVRALAISRDGTRLYSGDEAGVIKASSLPAGVTLKIFDKATCQVRSLAVSPDGHLLVSGHGDLMLRFWSLPEGNLIREVPYIKP